MKQRKGLKKVMSLMLAVMLVLGMGITALADDPQAPSTYDITVPAGDAHIYAVYQIFTGDYATETVDGKKVEYLSNIKWGQNGKTADGQAVQEGSPVSADILTELENVTGNDKALLAVIEKYVDLTGTAYKTITGDKDSDVTESVEPGYYLIKDSSSLTGDDAATLYIVQVMGPVTIARKADKPKVDKKVQENSDKSWGDHADWNIGDNVPFALIGTLPSNFDMYDTYKYIFHDTLSKGLTYNGDFEVYVVSADNVDSLENKTVITKYFSPDMETAEDGKSTKLSFSCDDLKKAGVTYSADTRIVVRYTAKLNKDAVIGNPGNPNKVKLEFSNNPNSGGDGDTGETPEKKVVVFTFELDGNKVDGKDNTKKLEGAEFKLYRITDETNKTKEYVQLDTDGKVTGWATKEEDGSVLKSGTDGVFKIIGLDAGTYYLKETKAPAGYNLLEDVITITITAEYTTTADDGTKITTLKATVLTGTESDNNKPSEAIGAKDGNGTITGVIGFNVLNNKGTTLPETGGIGTTVFYILGGILVLGCGAILVLRKRRDER